MARWHAYALVSIVTAFFGQTPAPHAEPAAYPFKPITMVVPTSAGGAVDVLARLIGVHLGNDLGQRVVVDNRPGAGGNTGTASVARAAPDGHTIIFISGTQLINQLATNPPPYDLFRDFEPVSLVAESYEVIGIPTKLAANTLQEFAAAARAEKSLFNYATPGIATAPHLGAVMLERAFKINMIHVPFRGSMEGMRELAAGSVQLSIGALPSFAPFMDRVKLIAVAGPKRLASLPNVPTTFELGHPDVEISFWTAILAPKGTSLQIVNTLNRTINKILTEPQVASMLSKLAFEPEHGDAKLLSDRMARYAKSYQEILKTIDLTPQK